MLLNAVGISCLQAGEEVKKAPSVRKTSRKKRCTAAAFLFRGSSGFIFVGFPPSLFPFGNSFSASGLFVTKTIQENPPLLRERAIPLQSPLHPALFPKG